MSVKAALSKAKTRKAPSETREPSSRQTTNNPAAGRPGLPLRRGIQASPSFVVTKSRVLSDEPVLPTFSRRRRGAAVDRTAEAQRPYPPTDCGVGPAILAAALLFAGGLVLSQALFSRDDEQIRLHQQEVAPVLRHD